MKKKVRNLVLAAVGVLVVVAVAASLLAPVRVDAVTLTPQAAAVTFTEQGVYTWSREIQVYPILSGEVLEVYSDEGDAVRKGDAVALLEAGDFESQIIQMESMIQGYNAQIESLAVTRQAERDELAALKTQLQGQMKDLKQEISQQKKSEKSLEKQIRYQEDVVAANDRLARSMRHELQYLLDSDMEDTSDYYAVEQAMATARTALAASNAQLEELRNGVLPKDWYEGREQALQAQIALIDTKLGRNTTAAMQRYYQAQIEGTQAMAEQLREKLGKAVITAPEDGIISTTVLRDSNVASAQSPAFVLGQDPAVEAFVSVRSAQALKAGDRVELIVEQQAGDEILGGTIRKIDDTAREKMSALGIEERKVRVLIDPDEKLLMGSAPDVRFTSWREENVLVVPKTAVFSDGEQDYVWAVSEGALRMLPVRKGVETREGFVVEEGLSEGSAVVRDADREGLREGKRAVT